MKRLLMLALIAGSVVATVPAHAASVTVKLEVHAGSVLAPAAASCAVSVSSGADGAAVLEGARASGCIQSYTLRTYSFGRLVECINDLCQSPDETLNFIYWSMTLNGMPTSYGIDLYQAHNSDALGFTYTSWAVQ